MGTATDHADLYRVLGSVRTESGRTLLSLVEASPVLLIFLRHFGCAFCRQAISDVAHLRTQLADRGVRPVFVHLGTPERARPFFAYYGIDDVERVSDPDASVYRSEAFALPKQPVWRQFVTPAVWSGWLRGALFKHGFGTLQEDAEQMPGIFLLKGPHIVRRFHFKTIADEPDYLALVA